jgi:hypothetical protein
MLEAQTFKDFELVVVDGLHKDFVVDPAHARCDIYAKSFSVTHVPPDKRSPWVRRRKVAISAYRNTLLTYAQGELIANLDDACILPPMYAAAFAAAWRNDNTCLAMCWPGDGRRPGRVEGPGRVFGFGSYPLEVAIALNGYDEAFDGAQGLEDMDWSYRLFRAGVRQALISLPGFAIEPQAGHSADAIDLAEPVVKCCNVAWAVTQPIRDGSLRAGDVRFWGDPSICSLTPEQHARRLALTSPCQLLNPDDSCQHHGGRNKCAYLGWARAPREDVRDVLFNDSNPAWNLLQQRLFLARSEMLP